MTICKERHVNIVYLSKSTISFSISPLSSGLVEITEEPKKNTWSSYKERKGNALALGADEGRD